MNNFDTEITSIYNDLTKTEKKVADYIVANVKEVLYMSITELATACNVGDASVYRFCKSMGYKGYQEFKIRLSLSLNENVLDNNTVTSDFNIIKNDTSRKYVSALNETSNLLEEEKVLEVVQKIEQMNNVYIFGIGCSNIPAQLAMTKFSRITSKVRYISDSHTQIMLSNILTENDMIILISYSGETQENINIAKNAKLTGATVVSITRYENSMLAEKSDIVLVCGADENPNLTSANGILIAQIYVIDLLFQTYYIRNLDESDKANQLTQNAIIKLIY